MICETCGHENVEGARFCANCGATLAVAVDAGHPLVGKVVGGRYRVTGVIGEGGMGVVYEAEQQMGTALRKVALKTLHAELSRDPSVTARFHREVGTVAQLEHPNTIKVYDFGAMDDGTLYIVMEYLAGRPLDQVIEQEGPLSPERVLHLVRQIAGSLEEAHEQGIIHRDLKPENVILIERAGERDVVKLLDFGIAARTESTDAAREAKLTQQGMVLGTPPYMSPEQFTGKALDRRSDVYSLAIMAYQMLTAHLPFDADTPWEWATQHMTAEPKDVDAFGIAVPEAMKEAIRLGLAKDREQRFTTAREFVEALEGASPSSVGKDHSAAAMMATAAMEEVPAFAAAGPAPTAAMPEVNTQPQRAVAAVPPAPARAPQAPSKQNKGLVLGLGALALLLAGGIALAVVTDGSGGSSEEEALLQVPPPTTIAPLDPVDEETTSEAETTEANVSEPEPSPASPPGPVAAPKPAPVPPPAPAPKPAPVPQPPASPKPAPAPQPAQPSGNDPCEQCRAAALSGNISSAAVYYRRCSDAAKKDACAKRARDGATNAAIAAAKQSDCSKANQIRIFANQMGAGSPRLDAAVQACKK